MGGSEWVRRCGGGGIRVACQGAVGLFCVVWLTSHTLHPALEDGTDRGFRNVGIQQSYAGEIPKRIHNRFKTRRKFEIKNDLLYFVTSWGQCKACNT